MGTEGKKLVVFLLSANKSKNNETLWRYISEYYYHEAKTNVCVVPSLRNLDDRCKEEIKSGRAEIFKLSAKEGKVTKLQIFPHL